MRWDPGYASLVCLGCFTYATHSSTPQVIIFEISCSFVSDLAVLFHVGNCRQELQHSQARDSVTRPACVQCNRTVPADASYDFLNVRYICRNEPLRGCFVAL